MNGEGTLEDPFGGNRWTVRFDLDATTGEGTLWPADEGERLPTTRLGVGLEYLVLRFTSKCRCYLEDAGDGRYRIRPYGPIEPA